MNSVDERFEIIRDRFANNKIDREFVERAYELAKNAHNGQYRKGTVIINGKECQLPYNRKR